jgi:hypothetical protein
VAWRITFSPYFPPPESKTVAEFSIQGDAVTPNNPAEVFYNDLPAAIADTHTATLKPHSYLTLSSQLTVAPWKVIPSTYIVCANDMAIPLAGQEGMIAKAKELAPTSFDVIERSDAGHSPFISQPEWLAEKLIKAASVP